MKKPFHGPRVASYSTIVDGRCVGTYSHTAGHFAAAHVVEMLAEGRAAVLERHESCAHPDCDGSGTLVRRKRGRMFPERTPCPQCAAGLGSVAVIVDLS